MNRRYGLRTDKAICGVVILLTLLMLGTGLNAQQRDVRAERIALDDNGNDGTQNTMIIQVPDSLPQNIVVTIPDPGSLTAEFLLAPLGSRGAWLLGGNNGTIPGTNFLGTGDSTPLHLYVNGGANNGLILNTNGSIQRDTGGITRGLYAVDLQLIRVDSKEVASGIYSVIGGGRENVADTTASTVAGGTQNRATGYKSFIGGGDGNRADGSYSVVAGGDQNFAYGWKNFIGGGDENQTDYDYAVVTGGNENVAVADGAFIGGGEHNLVAGGDGTIAGGYYNQAWGEFSAVGGGVANIAFGGISAIPGGAGLTLGGDGSFGYMGRNFGDNNMTILDSNLAVFGNVDLWLANNDTTARQLRFYEAESDSGTFPSGTNYTSFQAGDQSEDINYILPAAPPTANGQVLSSDTAGVMSWVGQSLSGWNLSGNSGTTPGTHFLGTTDFTALRLYVNGGANNSLILNTNGSLQRDTGGDARGDRAVDLQNLRDMSTHVASGVQSVIGGGRQNTASNGQATVAGGWGNVASGSAATVSGGKSDTASGTSSTVGGGLTNVASGEFSTVGGGESNTASQYRSAVSGGYKNTASGVTSTVGGGLVNAATGQSSTIAGGANNTAVGSNSAIGGGAGNSASLGNATVGGGSNNTASGISSTVSGGGGNTASAQHASVGGGNANTAQGESSTIGGGLTNLASGGNATVAGGALSVASGNNSTVGGGNRDTASGDASTVSGGQSNHASQNYATIGGGQLNVASEFHTTVGGGSRNTASGALSTVAGGKFNLASGSNSTVGGGISDTASGLSAVVSGGSSNRALGDYSTVAGGANNTASVQRSTISGGYQNTAAGPRSTVSGGEGNMASGDYSNIGGGRNDTASGANATVSGGRLNRAFGEYSTVGGGWNNIASGIRSTVSGGYLNTAAGDFSVIPGGSLMTLDSTADNSFGFLGGSSALRPMTIATPDVAVFANVDLWLANNNGAARKLRFYEPNSITGAFPNGTNYTSFRAQAQTEDIEYILPDTAGVAGDLLSVKSVSGPLVTLDWAAQQTINVSDSAWGLAGNSGTTAGTDYIGTNDAQALEIRVDNDNATGADGRGRVMRFEPNGTSANIIGGFHTNSVASGATGGTISGGGTNGSPNRIFSNNGTIGGGRANVIDTASINATIAGGATNTIASTGGAENGTIAGGLLNTIQSGDHTTISGGFNNQIQTEAFGSTVSGGTNNVIGSHTSVMGGGNQNVIGTSAQFSVAGGGDQNYIGNSAFGTTIAGGVKDTVESSASYSVIGGGNLNAIRSSATGSTIAGGLANAIDSGATNTTIAGGRGLTLSGSGSFGFLGGNTGSNNMTVSSSHTAVFGNTDLWLANNDTTASRILFFEANSSAGAFPNGTNYTSFEAGAQSADISYILPVSTAPSSTVKAGLLQLDTATGQLSWLNATQVTGGSWSLTGNAGISGGTFIGTTDSKPVRIYVNNEDGNALILNTNGSVQRSQFGGTRGTGAVDLQRLGNLTEGALGTYSIIGGGRFNNVAGDYSVIPGGQNMNLDASADGSFGFLANGFGHPMTISTPNIAVFGNTDLWLANNDNTASRLRFYEASGVTGAFPSASTFYTSFEAGDQSEDINYVLPTAPPTANGQVLSGDTTGVMSWTNVGGITWSLTGNTGTTPGTDFLGTTDATALHLYVNSGSSNGLILNTNGSVQRDTAGDARGIDAVDLQIERVATTQVASGDYATIAGGHDNTAAEYGSTVSGGENNVTSGSYSVVGGGAENAATSFVSTVSGGYKNSASGDRATVGGGGSDTASGAHATVGGGVGNLASGDGATIAGGSSNTAAGDYTTIPGGRGLTLDAAADRSFGFLGSNQTGSKNMTISAPDVAVFGNTDLWLANNDNAASQIRFYEAYNATGAFPNGTNYTSFQAQAQTADIEYLLPAAAGTVGQQLTISAVAGTQVTLGWAAASDRAKKTDFLTLSGESVLRKFRGLDLGTWRYDPSIDPKGTRHYGIMAQDFHAAFGNDGLGVIGTDTTVTNLDLHGVSYLAIQGLEERTSGQEKTIQNQAGHIEAQAERIEEQAQHIQSLETEIRSLHVQMQELRRLLEE